MWRFCLLLLILPGAGLAETLVAARTIRAQMILAPADVALVGGVVPGALTDPSEAVGFEARVVLYAGRPIRDGDVGPAAIIDRNQIVTLSFQRGSLMITTEGRALARGGIGDAVRVMNLASRTTVTGIVGADGVVRVPGGEPAKP